MNEIKIFENTEFGSVRTIEENGKVMFCGKDVAMSLGYKRPADAISAHCKGVCELPTPTAGGVQKMKFISEGDIYRLAAKSELPGAEKFESWIFDEVLPSIRRTGVYQIEQDTQQKMPFDYSGLSPQLQLLINIETQQQKQQQEIDNVNTRLDNMVDVISLDKNSWRKDSQHLISKIATKIGGFECMKNVYQEVFQLVEERAGVALGTRLTNKRNRMAGEGVCKSKRDKLTKIDIIAEDKKLIEIYVAIVKEMAVKYGVC